jgi:hypothetical protein
MFDSAFTDRRIPYRPRRLALRLNANLFKGFIGRKDDLRVKNSSGHICSALRGFIR